MDILTGLIKLLFGSKADKDRKEVEPYLNKIKEIYPSIKALSNDELRAHSAALRKRIADFIAEDEASIIEQKKRLESADISISEKEKISKNIDTTEYCLRQRCSECPIGMRIVQSAAETE